MTKTNQQKVKDFLINNGVIIVMFILVIYTGFTSDNFFTKNNFMNILMNMSSRLVIALGIAGCVITAGCDLSAGRMIGFGACISGMLLQRMDYSGKFFPDIRRSTDCHAGMRGIRYGYRIFHCLLKRSAFHRHTGNDGDRLWYRTYRNQCNTARRLCRAVHERI